MNSTQWKPITLDTEAKHCGLFRSRAFIVSVLGGRGWRTPSLSQNNDVAAALTQLQDLVVLRVNSGMQSRHHLLPQIYFTPSLIKMQFGDKKNDGVCVSRLKAFDKNPLHLHWQ